MINVKELFIQAKDSKKGMLELIVGIWTVVLIVALVSIIVTGVDFLTKKSKEANNGNTEVVLEESPSPAPTIPPTEDPNVMAGEEEDDPSDEEEDEDIDKEEDKDEEEEELVYTTENVNMRSSASLNASILLKVPKGTEVIRIKELAEGWSRVKYNGKEGYIKSEFLSTTKPVITNPNANTTKKPNNNNTAPTRKPTAAPTKTPKPEKTPKPVKTPKPTKNPDDDSNLKTENPVTPPPEKTDPPIQTSAPIEETGTPSTENP